MSKQTFIELRNTAQDKLDTVLKTYPETEVTVQIRYGFQKLIEEINTSLKQGKVTAGFLDVANDVIAMADLHIRVDEVEPGLYTLLIAPICSATGFQIIAERSVDLNTALSFIRMHGLPIKFGDVTNQGRRAIIALAAIYNIIIRE